MKNFKKVISVVMALAMIVCSFTAVSASDFADVADTAAYAEAVEVLGALGIVNGVEQENGTFNFEPEKSVTRAEAATMIVGALNMADAAAAGTSQFADVNSQAAWAAGFVNVGVAQGFIAGYDANTFGPLDNVTYAQMCVMLTKITGYGEYAQAYGGWPTGYTTMAATAGINTGVAVAQDAALTKGQVAMMIWNALQAPMLGVETYAINGNEYKPLDGTDGKFKTLFSEKFDGYVATMTIMKTPASDDNLDNDEVNVKVVKADWWPLEKAKYPSKDLEDGKVPNMDVNLAEGVDVNSNLLHTGKAVYLLDEDEEITIVYFAPTGRTASKELAADTYYLQKDLHADKQYTADNLKIRFGSSYYKFEDTITVYVNGVDAATIKAGETTKLDNILGNAHGTIKLLEDESELAEGKSLKGYNTIFVEFYQVAEVTSVDVDDDATTITLANSACLLGDDEIEEIVIETEAVEEGKSIVSVTRNGEVASLDSLVNGDVIAYAANFGAAEGDTLTNPKEIKIIATNDTVSGTVTAIDKNDDGLYDDVFTIGGADYIIVPGKAGLPAINVKDSLDVVLDPFGRIYDIETNADSAQYAIALKLGTEDNFIKLLLADGTTKTYEVDTAKAKNFTEDFVENKINNVKDVADRVVAYEVSGKTGKITYIEVVSGDSFVDREYKSRTSLVAGNKILDTTPIIRIDTDAEGTVLSNNSDYYTVFTKDDLVNETVYSGYAYKINTTVAFMVITSAGTSFGESSRVALAIDNPAEALTEDGDKVWSVKAYYNGEEQDLLFAANPGEIRGTVFFFETDSDGYVDAIYTPAEGDEAWEKMIDVEDWSYVLWDEHKDIQFVEGVVVEATSNGITFAALDQVKSGKLNTTLDLDDTKADGIVTYAIADDCAAYTYDAGMKTTKETEKYDITSASSIKASNFSAFDNGNGKLNDGIYEGDLMSKATVATAMIVDGQIVAIFAIEL